VESGTNVRPQILYPLFAPLTSLPGIGPKFAKLFEKLTGLGIVSLLWHLPNGLVDRSAEPPLDEALEGTVITAVVKPLAHMAPNNPKQPYRVSCVNDSGDLDLVFFNARADYLKQILPVGELRVVSGQVERYGRSLNMIHPDYILPVERRGEMPRFEPLYPLTAGLTAKVVGKAVRAALDKLPDLPEWADPHLVKRHEWPRWDDAIRAVHRPRAYADLDPASPPRRRVAYDELLANQLALSLTRQHNRRLPGRPSVGNGHLRGRVLRTLPYALTASQTAAIAEIESDLAGSHRMLRLLQGDVGSGKTIVALMAMLIAVEAGGQAALLAPTDILARQHFATLRPLAEAAGIAISLLTGREKGRSRDSVLATLNDGSLKIVVGTHALVQDDIQFADLRLAVVDEQHRFGVQQRIALAEKGKGVDLLVMTATPIPRTLMLTAYGDIEVSRLTEKPAGRQPIDTRVLPIERMDEVLPALRRAIAKGARVYWICPLVEESEIGDLAAATARHRALTEHFGDRVGLAHGRQKAMERDRAMADFSAGRIDILVATTVVEVGVDVPAATVMVIEHAERFGLAQLHQLRGRVGRGSGKSSCLLLYHAPLGETAKARLQIMRDTEDGFKIAEEDLRLRGGGEVLGTRQSGLPEFRLADLVAHADLIPVARDDAQLALERDPELVNERGRALRVLLYLFERDAVVRTLRSG
jgi:ATP-dependent DNA helicase RecG